MCLFVFYSRPLRRFFSFFLTISNFPLDRTGEIRDEAVVRAGPKFECGRGAAGGDRGGGSHGAKATLFVILLSLSLSVRRCQMREQHFVRRRRQRRDARRTDLQQRCPPPRRRRVVASFDFIGEILRAVLRVISVYNSVNESAIWQTAISFKTDREGGGRATGSHAGFR